MLPNIPLPPQPILTRWGTWIEAIVYLAEHLDDLIKVFDKFDVEESAAVKLVKDLLNNPSVKRDMIFISSNYGFLTKSIKLLEQRGLPLTEAVKIVHEAKANILNVSGSKAKSIADKIVKVFEKNTGFLTINQISAVLEGNETGSFESIDKISASNMCAFKFAPITSCDVERSFSHYKNLLNDDRRCSFKFENIQMHFVSQLNSF